MADIRVTGRTTPTRLNSDGARMDARGLRDGSLVTASQFEALAAEGRHVIANMGSVVSALTFLITAANRPDAWIRVPAGTTILPSGLTVALSSMPGTVTMIDVREASNDIGIGTSSAASVGPQSTRSDGLFVSACTARQLATADTTAETTPISLHRRTWIRADDAGSEYKSEDITREMMKYPVLVGPATWEVFIEATTSQATGFVVMSWFEVPTNSIV